MSTTFELSRTEAPDLAIMRQSKASCNDTMINIEMFHIQTAYLPSLCDKFSRLNATLNQADKNLRDCTQRLYYDITTHSDILGNYLDELAQSISDAERLEVSGDMAKELNAALKLTHTQVRTLAHSLLSISDTLDRTSTLRNIASFQVEQERIPEEIERIESSKRDVEAERATLTAAINAIESKGFGAIAQDTLLTAEKVAALGPTPPEAAVIQLALGLLKKSLEDIDAAFNFLGLVSLRNRLRQRSNEISATLRAKQREFSLLNRRVRMLEAVHAFDDEIQNYKREYSKVVDAIRLFETSLTRVTKIDKLVIDNFRTQAAAVVNYLKPIC